MADASVVGTFDTLDQAEAAVERLTAGGIDAGRISVIANNLQGSKTIEARDSKTSSVTSMASTPNFSWI